MNSGYGANHNDGITSGFKSKTNGGHTYTYSSTSGNMNGGNKSSTHTSNYNVITSTSG